MRITVFNPKNAAYVYEDAAITKIMNRITNNKEPVHFGDRDTMDNICGFLSNAKLEEDGSITADIEAIDTSLGRVFKSLLQTSVQMRVYITSYGTINNKGIVENFKFNSAHLEILPT